MTDVVTLGEALVAYRSLGRLVDASPLFASAAGAEMNVAIGLARLGHETEWVGALGDDPPGDLVLRTLRAEGVGLTHVRRTDRATTGVMLVDQPPSLPPVVTYHRKESAGSMIDSGTVDEIDFAGARVLYLSGITPALSPTAQAAVLAALRRARAAGALVAFDVNFRAKIWTRDEATAVLTPIARSADIVIASDDELPIVAEGGSDQERVDGLFAYTPGEVLIKRGRSGAELRTPTDIIFAPPFPVVEVNSIGAGDAFTAGYLSGLLDGIDPIERLRRACACGALAVTGHGDWEQAPTRDDLRRFAGTHEAQR